MNLLDGLVSFAVKRWQFTVLLFLMFAALGVSSWMAIPRAEDPDFPVPIFTIVAVYPGASPEDMEQLVTEPIEKQLDALEDVKKLTSTSSDGLSVVLVEFTSDVDAERKYDQVLREVNSLRPALPASLQRLDVKRNENSDLAVFELALVAPTTPYARLDDVARRFEDALARVDGVKTHGALGGAAARDAGHAGPRPVGRARHRARPDPQRPRQRQPADPGRLGGCGHAPLQHRDTRSLPHG